MNIVKYQKLINIFIISLFAMFAISGFVGFAAAAGLGDAFGDTLKSVAGEKGAGYNVNINQPETIIADYISAALSFVGVIFLILMVYGGFLWMTAKGNEQQVEKAKNLITAAVIGMVIVVSAYAITYFVTKTATEGVIK